MNIENGEVKQVDEAVSTPKEEVSNISETAPVEDIQSLKSELALANSAAEKWENEAKAHQRTASKKDSEAKRWQNEIGSLNAKLDVLAEIVEESVSSRGTDIEEGSKERSKERKPYKERIKNVPNYEQSVTMEIVTDIAKLTKANGLEFDKSPETREAYLKYLEGVNYRKVEYIQDALDKVKEVVGKKMAEVKETEEQRIERLVQERLKETLKKNGELNAEKGSPSGNTKTFTRQQINAMPLDEYKANRQAIAEAQAAGRIK
jgi:hypothetical protein